MRCGVANEHPYLVFFFARDADDRLLRRTFGATFVHAIGAIFNSVAPLSYPSGTVHPDTTRFPMTRRTRSRRTDGSDLPSTNATARQTRREFVRAAGVGAGALAMLVAPGDLLGAGGFTLAILAGLVLIVALHLVE